MLLRYDAVTKAQLDASVANISTNAYNITLGLSWGL